MKQKVTYTLLGEGYAEYAFLEIYLRKMYSKYKPDAQLVSSRLMIPKGGISNSSRVLANISKLCQISFNDRKDINLLVAGIDLDTTDFEDDLPKYKARIKEMIDKLGKLYGLFQDKIILFVPIQAIDYWILYQNYHLKNDAKPANNSLESVSKNDTKKKLYGKDINETKIERIAREVAEKADFEELSKQSKSFKLFHTQVENFINPPKKEK
jgi:hypothetical protein